MAAGTYRDARIGPYRLESFLGAGGMGEVYRAVHGELGRYAAVKILMAEGHSGESLERFRNEARIHAALHHPHIATLYDFLEVDGAPAIVMEYVDGQTLEERIQRAGRLRSDEALACFAVIVDAVGYLHRCGVVHRDLKSNNVKVSSAGTVKLLDFGIARTDASPKLTRVGNVVGTLQYLAPEQLRHGGGGPHSDIWSLGVLLYEMVTGCMPFEGEDPGQILARILEGSYSPPSHFVFDAPAGVDHIIERCLRLRPGQRYPSCEALVAEVRALQARTGGSDGRHMLPALPPLPLLPPLPSLRSALVPVQEILSPEKLKAARRHAPLAASMGAAAAGLLLLVWVGLDFARSQPVGYRDPVEAELPGLMGDGAEASGGRESAVGDSRATPASPASGQALRQLRIDVAEGRAEVYVAGRPVGQTPYAVEAALGDTIQVVLRRAGFHDVHALFTVTEGKREYVYVMPRLTAPPPLQSPAPNGESPGSWSGVLPLLFAWIFRRRRGGNGARVASTLELACVADTGGEPLELGVVAAVASDVGCVRSINEDAVRLVHPEDPAEMRRVGMLAVLADGMGGHSGGEIASRLAVEAVMRCHAGYGGDPRSMLIEALRNANRAVYKAAQRDAALNGMGTTCTALVLRQGLAFCAHVGDSRLYLVRTGAIFRMTEDHSAVMEMVRRGVMTREQAGQHPWKHVIVRALGSRSQVDVASWPQPLGLRADDRFVLCSDGLHDLVTDEELLQAALTAPPVIACERLVALARDRGAQDNVSVAVIAVQPSASASQARTPAETRAVEVIP
jgi:serine/threonine protein phosphatase PrpC/predicted Ser/Thr protein kinase